MGVMIDGIWHSAEGPMNERFRRGASSIRERIGSMEDARYVLYAHRGCPWAHRTRIVRRLLGLEGALDEVLAADLPTSEDGWVFDDSEPDPLGHASLHELYAAGAQGYTGRCTVPILWDRQTGTIVNNESADIIRNLDDVADGVLRPVELRASIDEINERVYEGLNNGVYRAGFAQSQAAHDAAASDVFATLDWLEDRLGDGRAYVCGDVLTEADVRLWPTLLRFLAYREVFYCDLADWDQHPAVWAYRDRALDVPAIASTTMPAAYYVGGYGSIPFAAANNPAILSSGVEVGLTG